MKMFFRFFILIYCFSLPANQYNCAICAIFRDDGEYLKEWIEFHLMQGIDHFYLYNHLSQDNFREVLDPYIHENIVTLVEWPYETPKGKDFCSAIQSPAYWDCIQLYGHECTWMAVIDTDEFLFCPDGTPLSPLLKKLF